MIRALIIFAVGIVVGTAVVQTAAATSSPGKRVVVVTERIDQPGQHESIPHTFILDTDDRLYVTRHDAYLIHTDTGLTDEVEFQGTPIGFGNLTVSRVGR